MLIEVVERDVRITRMLSLYSGKLCRCEMFLAVILDFCSMTAYIPECCMPAKILTFSLMQVIIVGSSFVCVLIRLFCEVLFFTKNAYLGEKQIAMLFLIGEAAWLQFISAVAT